MGNKNKYGPGVAGSKRELGRKVDRDEKVIRLWIKREDWPFSEKGPWKVKDVKVWMDAYLDSNAKNDGTKIPELTRARVEATIERTLLTRQRRLVERGELIESATAQRLRLQQIHTVKSALLSLARSIANSLVGKKRGEIEKIIQDRIESIIRDFSGE